MTEISWTIPIKTISESNCSEHWTAKSKRHRSQQKFVRLSFLKYGSGIVLPCTVRLIRQGLKRLDTGDNLPMSLKWVRDELSECLLPEKDKFYLNKKGKVVKIKGRADDDPRITWQYDQEVSKSYGVKIVIEC